MPCLYIGSLEEPLRLANSNATLRFELEYLEAPAPEIMLKPTIVHDGVNAIHYEEARLFECAKPGMIHQNIYYRFPTNIKRKHLRHLPVIQNVTIPEPLFGTFVENSLPELLRFSEVTQPRYHRPLCHPALCWRAERHLRHQLPKWGTRCDSALPL